MIYSKLYLQDLCNNDFDVKSICNKNICISGATGLIGSYFIDYLLTSKDFHGIIFALVRNIDNAKQRFYKFVKDKRLHFIMYDFEEPLNFDDRVDVIIHAASLTDPIGYSKFPVETMSINIFGLSYLLNLCKQKNSSFIFLSSCEVYGINPKENLKENDYGYINILDSRASYNEAKRCCETFCVSFAKEFNADVKILRLSRVFGPTMKMSDSKALSQFIRNGLLRQNIVLKSAGTQKFNYTYVSDVVGALIILISRARQTDMPISYNFTNTELYSLKEIATYIATLSKTSVIFDIPSEIEKQGYSKSTISSMDCSLFESIYGFAAKTPVFEGIKKTISILQSKE